MYGCKCMYVCMHVCVRLTHWVLMDPSCDTTSYRESNLESAACFLPIHYIHTYIHTYIYTYIHKNTWSLGQVENVIHKYCTVQYIHTYIHTYIHAHTHIAVVPAAAPLTLCGWSEYAAVEEVWLRRSKDFKSGCVPIPFVCICMYVCVYECMYYDS